MKIYLLPMFIHIGIIVITTVLCVSIFIQHDVQEYPRYSYDALTTEIQLLKDERATLRFQVDRYSNLYSVLTRYETVINSE